MDKQEFIKSLLDFGFDWDEECLICSQTHIVFPETEENTEWLFHIYQSFCFPIYDYEENFDNSILAVIVEKTKNELTKEFSNPPDDYLEASYGCPHDDLVIGYYSKEYDIKFVEKFVEICDSIDVDDSDSDKIQQNIIETIDHRITDYDKCSFSKENNEYYIDSSKKLIVFVGDVNELSVSPKNISQNAIVVNFMTQYRFLGRTQSGDIVTADSATMVTFFELCDYFNIDKTELSFYTLDTFLLICGKISGLLPLLKEESEIVEVTINKEYAKLVYKLFELRGINPNISINEFDFSHLNASDFESLCYDLLMKLGFIEVRKVGKTNASDGGKDIICYEEYRTILGTEKRKWIWQCKHSKKSLDRKDISEIGDLLEENEAKAYGLFCSNDLTPMAIERLENKKKTAYINYYAKIEITLLLSKYPDLIVKYKLVGRKSNA